MTSPRRFALLVVTSVGLAGCGAAPPWATLRPASPAPPPGKTLPQAFRMVDVDAAGQAKLARVPDRPDLVLTVSGSGIARARTLRKPDDVAIVKWILGHLTRRKGEPAPSVGSDRVEFRFAWKGGSETLVYGLDPTSPYAFRLADALAESGVRRRRPVPATP